MSHTPFGYRIENGKAVIDKEAAEQIKVLFQSYLSGDSLATAAKKAGIKGFHSGIGRILRNKRYLGDEFYPAIIDKAYIKKFSELTTNDLNHQNPEIKSIDELISFFEKIYEKIISADDTVTVIYFSEITEA